MIKLNLITSNEAEKLIKEYLENNVSEELAIKINNGVAITKDNKTLINKKDLKCFMNYANQEARKLAEKGANYACIEHTTVFGWAIHYFEEDSIEGKLFNEDGTESKTITKTNIPTPPVKVVAKPKEENKQATLFDLMNLTPETQDTNQSKTIEPPKEKVQSPTDNFDKELEEEPIEFDDIEDNNDDFTEEEFDKALDSVAEEIQATKSYQIDKETGEVLQTIKTFDKETMKMLYTILDGKLEAK